MCGIAGIFGSKAEGAELERRLIRMQKALRHRGPDDQGLWINPEATAGLCHTRLSILDLSEAGHQPMAATSGRYEIAFNGEIYNYEDIREGLKKEGHSFRSHSDTEVILNAYQRDGEKCLTQFDGMFAFGIYDVAKKRGFLARDPFGIKPLYYYSENGLLIFASEVRTLLASGLIEPRLCARAVDSFLRCGSVQEPDTMIAGIHTLRPGTYLNWSASEISIKDFAAIDFSASTDGANAVERVSAAFRKTIRRHLVSDVPVGVFLSGGIDSSCIAKAVTQETQLPTQSYSIALQDASFNEAPTARRFAAEIGTEHHEYLLREEEIPSLFSEYLASLDQPSIDGFNTFCVSRFAQQQGAKVVLSGLGGDELFGGYGSFTRVPRLLELSKRFYLGNPLLKSAASIAESVLTHSQARRGAEWLQKSPSVENSYHLVRSIFSKKQARHLQNIIGLKLPQEWIAPAPPHFSNIQDQVSYLEITGYMRNQLLKDSDVMSMAHGLELRVPLVDWEFFQTVAGVSPEMRFRRGKQLLVDAVGGLPTWITAPPKKGFLFPFSQWNNVLWKNYRPSVFKTDLGPNWPWYQRWAVRVLDDWMQRYGVRP
ncbi:MAG: asparagine synthase (glutamine-hydrolyzing) [Chthoniobacterales bacterium]